MPSFHFISFIHLLPSTQLGYLHALTSFFLSFIIKHGRSTSFISFLFLFLSFIITLLFFFFL